MHKSIYQQKKSVELILVPNNNQTKDCYLVSDSEELIIPGDSFFCTKTNEILECFQTGLSGVFTENDKGFFPFSCCKKVMAKPEQIGWMWDNHPDDINDTYLVPFITEKDLSMIDYVLEEYQGKCEIEVQEICPNYDGAHIGKDCSCKMGFIDVPKLVDGKVIIHH